MAFHPKQLLLAVFFFSFNLLNGQVVPVSPELQQMYGQATTDISMGNLNGAIIIYKNAGVLDPGNPIIFENLGKCYYLTGSYQAAIDILEPNIETTDADTDSYITLAKCFEATNRYKKADNVIKQGLSRFPLSGLLYHMRGQLLMERRDKRHAVRAWVEGISKAPDFPLNYFDAALGYLATDQPMWGLIYGEIFLDLPHDTLQDDSMKQVLFTGWTSLFDNIAKSANTDSSTPDFMTTTLQVFTQLTPVVSDGITAENLTMVRTRFLMEWYRSSHHRFPFSLYAYQDNLIRNGKFEIYNEWLFGKVENKAQFEAWNKFHEGDIGRFLKWKSSHTLLPTTSDAYNGN